MASANLREAAKEKCQLTFPTSKLQVCKLKPVAWINQVGNISDSLTLRAYAYDVINLAVTKTLKLKTKEIPATKVCILKVFFTHTSP